MRVDWKSANRTDLGSGNPAIERPGAPASTPPRIRGHGTRLVAELIALGGGQGVLVAHRQHAWASVTFSGTRHELEFRYDGEAAIAGGETFIARLSDHEFKIPRQLVADAAVVEVSHKMLPQPVLEMRCEVLLLDEE